ncbi:MAG: nicotinate-nucleotide adenylyltransferase [Planctomycetes bacterium]|nr:nicotinate-nucleotide adenylyltransferase [Planctomycetota bacterium]
MRLGIYGGSFDPAHYAHLALARACQEQARLDEVWFMPTAVQPLKQHGPLATDAQRIEMLRLAIHHERGWRVSTLEIDRGGLSYTVDTLRHIRAELPDARLFFLMGADTLSEVPEWRESAEIFRLATPLVVRRAGRPEPDLSPLAELCPEEKPPLGIEMAAMAISSTEIRHRVATGKPIDELVPPAVAVYIAEHDLYR